MRYGIALITAAFSIGSVFAADLPDMIRCNQGNSSYQLVIVVKSSQLPDGVTAIGLKKGADVIFKVATDMYTDANGLLSFEEVPATANSKEVKLNVQT